AAAGLRGWRGARPAELTGGRGWGHTPQPQNPNSGGLLSLHRRCSARSGASPRVFQPPIPPLSSPVSPPPPPPLHVSPPPAKAPWRRTGSRRGSGGYISGGARGAVVAASSCDEVPLGHETMETVAAVSGPDLGRVRGREGRRRSLRWSSFHPFAPPDLPSSYPSCSPAATPPLLPHAALELEEMRTTCGRAQAGDMCDVRLLCFPYVSLPEFYGQYCLSEMCC
uniref:Uncharacterized protein n=1 Tax=Triticum urartu TaxID=4572 RepID=A0A8R7JXG4_TRIUA